MNELLRGVVPEIRARDWPGRDKTTCRRLVGSDASPWVAFSLPRPPLAAFVSEDMVARAGTSAAGLEALAVQNLAATPATIRRTTLSERPGAPEVALALIDGERAASRILDRKTLLSLSEQLGTPTLALMIPTTHQLLAVALASLREHPIEALAGNLHERGQEEHRVSPGLFVVHEGHLAGALVPAPRAAPEPVKAAGPDFVALASAAHPRGGTGPREAMDALWTALFRLDGWLFATSPGDPTRPYVAQIEGRAWAFVFTDAGQLERFVKENGLRGPGELTFVSMSVEGARRWIAEMGSRGLFGVHFNFGGPGWFAPVGNVEGIYEHLMGE